MGIRCWDDHMVLLEVLSNLLTFLGEMGFQPPSQTKLREKSIEEAGGEKRGGRI